LPEHLRKDAKGYFLDFFTEVGGISRRKRVRLGQIPLQQAKRILAEHLGAIIDKRFLANKTRVLFGEAAESYLAYSRARKKSHEKDRHHVQMLTGFFKDRPLDCLTPDMVEEYVLHRKMMGKDKGVELKGSTLNREIETLKSIARRAVLNNQIDRNPIFGVKKFKETPRSRTLTGEEFRALLAVCKGHLRPVVELAYYTGMRKGEILGLLWDQVNLREGFITLRAEDTKTQENREVPLDGVLLDTLRRLPRVPDCPYVFTYAGKRLLRVKTGFVNACRKVGIKDFHFHDLRHCFVRNARRSGVSDTVIMSITGHRSHRMFRRYDSVDREDRLGALQRLRDFNDTGMTPERKEVKLVSA